MITTQVFMKLSEAVNYFKKDRDKELTKLELDILLVLGSDLGAYSALDISSELTKLRSSITPIGVLYANLAGLARKKYISIVTSYLGQAYRLPRTYYLLPKGTRVVRKYSKLTENSRDFYRYRIDVLNDNKNKFREPERTMLIDILANGSLAPDEDRYSVKDDE